MKTEIIIKQKNFDDMQVKIKGNHEIAINMLCYTSAHECANAGIKKAEFINYMKEFYDSAKQGLDAYSKENG